MDHRGFTLSKKKKKKGNHKRSHTIWFHFCNILKMTKLQRWKADHFLGSRMAQGWAAGVTRRCSRGGSAPRRHGERRAWRGACAHASRHCGFPALAAASQGHTRPSRGTGGPARGRRGGRGTGTRPSGGTGGRHPRPLCAIFAAFCDATVSSKFKV